MIDSWEINEPWPVDQGLALDVALATVTVY